MGRGTAAQRLRQLLAGAYREGWAALLELVVLGMIWSLCMFVGGAALVGNLIHGVLYPDFALPAIAIWAPATIGLHAAADGIWSGASVGPFDMLRNFGRGFGRRYLRGVGLSALWVLVLLGTYANVRVSGHVLPGFLLLGTRVLLAYLVLFVLMVNVYLVPILATTDYAVWPALRISAWQAVAGPLYTLGAMLVPAVVVVLGTLMGLTTAVVLWALLLGGAIGMMATGALRYAPLRHPDLPEPEWLQEPEPEAEDPAPEAAQGPAEGAEPRSPGPEGAARQDRPRRGARRKGNGSGPDGSGGTSDGPP